MLNQDALNRDYSLLIAGNRIAIGVPGSARDRSPCSGGDDGVVALFSSPPCGTSESFGKTADQFVNVAVRHYAT
jgi:hypothetical protein